MIQNTTLETVADIFLKTEKVSFWIYNFEWDLIYTNSPCSNELRNIFFLGKNTEKIDADSDTRVAFLDDDFGLSWIVLTYQGQDYSKGYYILGPILITTISENILRERMSIKDMSVSSQIKFINLVSNIPVMPQIYFTHLGSMLYYCLFHETFKPEDIYASTMSTTLPEQSTPISEISAKTNYHGSYAIEQKILENVVFGNIYFESSNHMENNYATVGTMAIGDPIRQRKNEMIVYTTLVARAAIRGGLPSETAYNLSDQYIQKIEACQNGNELILIGNNMYSTFIHQVHALKNQTTYSYAVTESLAMLHANIPLSVDISEIAKTLGYSTYYLTRQILKETGKSFKEHLASAKIEYAKKQLLDPKLSISSISEVLKYSTPSYFSAQFKKIAGCTPKEYRLSKLNKK